MSETVSVAVPRKGRPLEAVLERVADRWGAAALADEITSQLRYEKAITKGDATANDDVYDRLATYSDLSDPYRPEYTLLRDDRPGFPRRLVLDSVTIQTDGPDVRLVGREEPFRALRTHEFALGFDAADLVLEEVVTLQPDPLERIGDLNDRIEPEDTDVRVVTGLGDTVYHTLLATPEVRHEGPEGPLDRAFVDASEGRMCISPRYERLVQAVLGTEVLDGVEFVYPGDAPTEEAAIADTGLGVYLTMTGSTARDHGLEVGAELFPSETVLLQNEAEVGPAERRVVEALGDEATETELAI